MNEALARKLREQIRADQERKDMLEETQKVSAVPTPTPPQTRDCCILGYMSEYVLNVCAPLDV